MTQKLSKDQLRFKIESCIDEKSVNTDGQDNIWENIADQEKEWKSTLLIHLGLDPVSITELRIALEDKLNIVLPTSFDDAVKTLGDVLNAIKNDAKYLKEEEYNVGT